jgi:hypothetical protein
MELAEPIGAKAGASGTQMRAHANASGRRREMLLRDFALRIDIGIQPGVIARD